MGLVGGNTARSSLNQILSTADFTASLALPMPCWIWPLASCTAPSPFSLSLSTAFPMSCLALPIASLATPLALSVLLLMIRSCYWLGIGGKKSRRHVRRRRRLGDVGLDRVGDRPGRRLVQGEAAAARPFGMIIDLDRVDRGRERVGVIRMAERAEDGGARLFAAGQQGEVTDRMQAFDQRGEQRRRFIGGFGFQPRHDQVAGRWVVDDLGPDTV